MDETGLPVLAKSLTAKSATSTRGLIQWQHNLSTALSPWANITSDWLNEVKEEITEFEVPYFTDKSKAFNAAKKTLRKALNKIAKGQKWALDMSNKIIFGLVVAGIGLLALAKSRKGK